MKRGELHTAPMHRYTSLEVLRSFRWMSHTTVLHHEMVTLANFLRQPQRWHCDLSGVVFQIASDDHPQLETAARLAAAMGYRELNWNLGCPSPAIQALGGGAALFQRPDAVLRGLERLQRPQALPCSIKCRIGVDDEASLDNLLEFIRRCSEVGGCQRFYIHARKAWLRGVSPRENRSLPPLQTDWVRACKAAFPHCQVILNGGLSTLEAIQEAMHNLDGAMVGRAFLKQPLLLAWWEHRHASPSSPFDAESFWWKLESLLQNRLQAGVPKGSLFQRFARAFAGSTWHEPWQRQWKKALSEPGKGLQLSLPSWAFEALNGCIENKR